MHLDVPYIVYYSELLAVAADIRVETPPARFQTSLRSFL